MGPNMDLFLEDWLLNKVLDERRSTFFSVERGQSPRSVAFPHGFASNSGGVPLQ